MITTRKKILIGGCSFNDAENSWINQFLVNKSEYEVNNVAKTSYGNSRIAESIVKELAYNKLDYYDKVIVQWSAVGRAYAHNEEQIFQKIKQTPIDSKAFTFIYNPKEYLIAPEDTGKVTGFGVTNLLNIVSDHLYESSLLNMLMCKTFLEKHNIDYRMYWGWQQIDRKLSKKFKDLLKNIYSDRFIRYQKHGGESEYIVSTIGEKKGIIENDFHPTAEGHRIWYRYALQDFIEEN